MQRKVIIVAAILLAIVLIIAGIGFWRVLVEYIVPRDPGDRKDVIQTFALVVAGLVGAIGGAVSIANLQTSRRTLQHQRELENQRAQEQRLVEGQRAQDDALQSYLDKISQLLTDKGLRSKTHVFDDSRVGARAISLAILSQLDGERKRSVLQFLYEAQLINRWTTQELGPDDPAEVVARIVGLDGANLRNANLRYLTLEGAALNGAILENADLRDANLNNIDLGGAYLSGADLSRANLSSASLVHAHLQRKGELNVSGADLSGTDLSGTDLSGTDLSGADLYEAKGWTEEQLTAARSLKGATMPNGQKYEDWLKSKGSREDGENSSPS